MQGGCGDGAVGISESVILRRHLSCCFPLYDLLKLYMSAMATVQVEHCLALKLGSQHSHSSV